MLLLVDLDGVVYRGSVPVPGVAAVLAARAAVGDEVVYVTNNSMWYRADYVARLSAMGAPVSPDRVVSSARATGFYLRSAEPAVRRVLTVGAPGLERELRDAGFEVVPAAEAAERRARDGLEARQAAADPDAVVVGLDREVTYARLAVAAETIRAGVRFVATNRDPVFPTERALQPGAGAVVAFIEAASGVTPVSIGKPAPFLLREAARAVGRSAEEAVMVGDGLLTDLAAARAVGARSVLMLTGVTTAVQVEALPPAERPTEVAADAAALAAALDRLAADDRVLPAADGVPAAGD
ncbi:MAG TPA: HAD-IIA family hydrolase [Candidatus Limnocylindrales bacterium]